MAQSVDTVAEHLTTMRRTCLDGTNYNLWKMKMKAQLMRNGLWDVIEKESPSPVTASWTATDRKVYGTLLSALCVDQLANVTMCNMAKEVWSTLKDMYERKTFGTKLCLMRKLFSMRYTGGPMRQHVTAVREMANQLSDVGEIVKLGYIVAVLMNSLPESYLPMVTILKGHKEEELTANYVAAKLEDEYECRQEVGTDRHDDNKACRRQAK